MCARLYYFGLFGLAAWVDIILRHVTTDKVWVNHPNHSCFGVRDRGISGRGQPLSLALSFGEIPWFDVGGKIQRCDWLKRTHNLGIHFGYIPEIHVFRPITALYFAPYIKPRNLRQTTVQC